MGDAGGQERDRVHLFRLDGFPGLRPPRRHVVENKSESHQGGVLVLQRDQVETQIARLGIKNL